MEINNLTEFYDFIVSSTREIISDNESYEFTVFAMSVTGKLGIAVAPRFPRGRNTNEKRVEMYNLGRSLPKIFGSTSQIVFVGWGVDVWMAEIPKDDVPENVGDDPSYSDFGLPDSLEDYQGRKEAIFLTVTDMDGATIYGQIPYTRGVDNKMIPDEPGAFPIEQIQDNLASALLEGMAEVSS